MPFAHGLPRCARARRDPGLRLVRVTVRSYVRGRRSIICTYEMVSDEAGSRRRSTRIYVTKESTTGTPDASAKPDDPGMQRVGLLFFRGRWAEATIAVHMQMIPTAKQVMLVSRTATRTHRLINGGERSYRSARSIQT